jgi:hypothetical protein
MLEENEKNLTDFLDRIAQQEEDSRNTMDCIPDHIVVLDHEGRILKTNASFERGFQTTTKKLEQGLFIGQYLVNLEKGFFTRGVIDQLETEIRKSTGLLVPVTVTCRPMNTDERYLVVIRNIAEKLTLMEQLQKQQNQMQMMTGMMRFDTQLQDVEFRTKLRKYCQNEYNEENMAFVEDVLAYKSKGVTERMGMQDEIYNTYIRVNAPKQINIDELLVQETLLRLQKSLGEANVFDPVLEKIKTMMLLDIVPRFYQAERLK